ncbi:nuclear transport factor 2 family protein [Noviherbaspirillum saxi]|uniref:Nuclear transport factor 2 family protein n=1 Tax=Noviherbaspirillum saxi TaxID=2320863 RepID=A0A3A3FNH3_9BURK|nr:nuclear transport factor 2 family protein [Noviherbaspirillum saxi]RJF95219.1 nuclear transport factor 2 family protein [Noviherbaspirillum saxi]
MKYPIFAALLSLASIGSAFAGPASDAAQTHFNAIASGDLSIVMRGYAANPQLNWVGGPLDGTYVGADSIRTTWEKFAKAAGPLKVSVTNLDEAINPKGATVSANVLFEGKQPIKVRYVLTYRDGLLVNETWQIDPKLTVAAAY